MSIDDTCTLCGVRKVELDQIGKEWRVCTTCQGTPEHHLLDGPLSELEEALKEPVRKRKPVDWTWPIGISLVILVGAVVMMIDWSSINLSDNEMNALVDLLVFAVTMSIILGVRGYVMAVFRRF